VLSSRVGGRLRLEQGAWTRRVETDKGLGALQTQHDETARRLAEIERTLQRLLDAYEIGAITLDDFTTRSGRIKERARRVQAELTDVDSKIAGTTSLRSVVAHIEAFAARVRSGIDRLTWPQRRDLIRQMVARVEVDHDGATIVFRVPSPPPTGPASPGPSGGAPGGPDEPGVDGSFPRRGRRVVAAAREHLAR